MAVPVAIAGAGIAARGFASWLAKKKATEAAAKGAVRTMNSRGRVYPTDLMSKTAIPNLVSGSRASKGGLAGYQARLGAGAAGYGAASVMTKQPNGGDLHPRIEAMERLRNPRVGMTGLGGGYMANPMMDYRSQDPSYDSSMTEEGQIQTMMEEMDGMDMSEDAKRQIIADKLGVISGVGFESQQDRTGSARRDSEVTSDGSRTFVDGIPVSSSESQPESQRKVNYFEEVVNNPNAPMDQRITAALRRESGAAFNPEEVMDMRNKIEAMDAERAYKMKRQTGGAATPREMKMFMGRPY